MTPHNKNHQSLRVPKGGVAGISFRVFSTDELPDPAAGAKLVNEGETAPWTSGLGWHLSW